MKLTGIGMAAATDIDEVRTYDTPGELAAAVNPHTVQTPALDLIDKALVEAANTPDARLIITMPPQEGKSTRVAHDFILWTLHHKPSTRIVGASYAESLARRNGLAVRRSIEAYGELGLNVARDNGSATDWELQSTEVHELAGGLFSVGVGGGMTGRAADMIIIDDPCKSQKEADSPVYRETVWDWWQTVVSTRLAPGAPVIVILTRWHEDDLAGKLIANDPGRWTVLNIPALAEHDPSKGETDILGREPGEFMISARGRTTEQWEIRRKDAGKRGWQSLYQGDPSPAEGLLFNVDDFRYWTRFPTRVQGDRVIYLNPEQHIIPDRAYKVIESWDLTFTGTESSDWTVGQRWAAHGSRRLLLAQQRAKLEFPGQLTAMRKWATDETWGDRTHQRLVEKAANGAAALATLKGKVGSLKAIKPTEAKEARAWAVTPQVEAHDVYLPHPLDPGNEWVADLIEEIRQFPAGRHDDQVDAMTQFLNEYRQNKGGVIETGPPTTPAAANPLRGVRF